MNRELEKIKFKQMNIKTINVRAREITPIFHLPDLFPLEIFAFTSDTKFTIVNFFCQVLDNITTVIETQTQLLKIN